jgi:hypothetical protein
VSDARSTAGVAATFVTGVLAWADNTLPRPMESKMKNATGANLLRNQDPFRGARIVRPDKDLEG